MFVGVGRTNPGKHLNKYRAVLPNLVAVEQNRYIRKL